MRRRHALFAPLVIAVAAACGSHPHANGTVRVRVVDDLGTGIPGVIVFSTARGSQIDRTHTGVLGTAEIAVVSGGEITAVMARSSTDRILTTVADVQSGDVTLPLDMLVLGDIAVTVQVLGTSGYANVIAGRCEVSVPATGVPTSITVAKGCTHGDGTFSVSAQRAVIVNLTPDDSTGYAEDVPIGQVAVVSLGVSTAATVTDVPWALTNIPANVDLTVSQWPSHRGLRLGPQSLEYLQPSGSANGSFGIWSSSFADGSESDFDLFDRGDYGKSSGLRVRQSGTGAITADASLLPPFLASDFEHATGSFVFTDPAASVRDTRLSVSWQDGNSVTHTWTLYAPPPAVAGPRKITLPRVPSSLSGFVTDLYAPPGFYDLCTGYIGPAQPAFQSDPNPDLPAGDGFVAYSRICRLY
jgi:hypothetical protein